MTIERKTPKARKEARNYCRRCLAVMLCCVLAFGFTVRVTPRAQAVGIIEGTSAVEIAGWTVIEGGAAAGGAATAVGAAANPVGATIGLILLTAAGIPFVAGYIQNDNSFFVGSAPYELGDKCYDALYDAGPEIADWLLDVTGYYNDKGGINPGDTIKVPAHIAEAVRQWAGTNLNFADGVCTYDQAAIATTDGDYFVLSEVDTSGISNWSNSVNYAPVISMGTPIRQGALTWAKAEPGTYEISNIAGQFTFTRRLIIEEKSATSFSGSYSFATNFSRGSFLEAGHGCNISYSSYSAHLSAADIYSRAGDFIAGYSDIDFLFYSRANNRIYLAKYAPVWDGQCRFGRYDYVDVSKYGDLVLTEFPSTFTKDPALDQPKTEDLTVTVPQEIPTTQVGELTIPVFPELTPNQIIEVGQGDNPAVDPTPSTGLTPSQITDAVTEALPDSGSVLGDQTIEETMNNPDDLGATVITKFPFSIPWDIAKAIKLLAAPPTPPKWEVDLFGPLEGQWGFHSENTSLVSDFERLEPLAVVVRWVSTVMFVYALASATKRFIWTA